MPPIDGLVMVFIEHTQTPNPWLPVPPPSQQQQRARNTPCRTQLAPETVQNSPLLTPAGVDAILSVQTLCSR